MMTHHLDQRVCVSLCLLCIYLHYLYVWLTLDLFSEATQLNVARSLLFRLSDQERHVVPFLFVKCAYYETEM